jgi:hypothetical protein
MIFLDHDLRHVKILVNLVNRCGLNSSGITPHLLKQ